MSTMSRSYVGIEDQQKMHPCGRGGGCLGCCCCLGYCLCFFLFIIFLVLGIVAGFYLFSKPQVPRYSVDGLNITTFDIRDDNKVYSEIGVVVKAENANKDIALDYGENNISLIYSGSQLCSGNFPPFMQPGMNTTMISLVMKGEGDFQPQMAEQFMQQNNTGRIPLLVTVKVPVRLVVRHTLHMIWVVIDANCTIDIDHLGSNHKPNILRRDIAYTIEY